MISSMPESLARLCAPEQRACLASSLNPSLRANVVAAATSEGRDVSGTVSAKSFTEVPRCCFFSGASQRCMSPSTNGHSPP